MTSQARRPFVTMLPIFALAGLVGGCTMDATRSDTVNERVGETTQSVVVENGTDLNGVDLNGVDLNGVDLNGVDLNGVDLNGVDLNGVDLNGVDLNGVDLNGTNLSGVTAGGATVSGSGLIGSTWRGALSNGNSISLRIDDTQMLTGANADLRAYAVSYQTSSGWKPLCGVEKTGGPVLALPLAGSWSAARGVPGGGAHRDDGQIPFACRHAVLSKCVEIGYRPWARRGDVSLAGYHQACTRMLRADYCGDGTPGTVTGTKIDVSDALGIQVSDGTGWKVEAEWTATGARCTSDGPLRWHLTHQKPRSCMKPLRDEDCGQRAFRDGSILMDQYRPSGERNPRSAH